MNIYKTLAYHLSLFLIQYFFSPVQDSVIWQWQRLLIPALFSFSKNTNLNWEIIKERNSPLFYTNLGRRVFISSQMQRREPGTRYKFIYFHLLRLKWTINIFRLVVKIVHSLFNELQEPTSYKSHLS